MTTLLVERLKRAYHANRIPVPDVTEAFLYTLTDETLIAVAQWWEARAAGENPMLRPLTIREAKERISRVGGPPPNGTRAARRVASHSFVYHGSIRE